MNFSEQQVEILAPDAASLKAGRALSNANQWLAKQFSDRVLWGEIKGSGSKPYRTQIDLQNIAYKCSCPSFKFPCKHGIGLMLAFAKQPTLFSKSDLEPDWVKEWIDKRISKAEKIEVKIESESSSNTDEKAQKSKEKRQTERLLQVEGGVAELELWLKDLLRAGFLALPNKDSRFFEQIAARMVDAKATGLAGRVRAFKALNYQQNNDWQQESLRIAAELFLLIEAFKNASKLSLEWQQSLKNLVGWNQSSKDLLQNHEAEKVKDIWIVLGQEQQETEGIIVQRNWLGATKTNRSALILNFGTPFSPLENAVLPGALIEAELAFFPSVLPHRAIINLQKGFVETLEILPEMLNDWTAAFQFRSEQLSKYPFVNDIPMIIKDLRFVLGKKQPILCDSTMHYHEISLSWAEDKMLTLYAYAGNTPVNLAGVFRHDGFLPLGVFNGDTYLML
ncbi:SWIM zinc finger family protein [Arcicella sp. DC2W]|uniref:SWIM zinc finger family protein n=1 Tax=Arcicella gelida TaxID=2984195 RepID=A0ABU5S5R3_9BACT|nr:SWIM zinc finger family protein [Arcicella sp. DC2W]MEA5403578.1 SWIM zinc finger family protein [Arcicella sp. DC2W]